MFSRWKAERASKIEWLSRGVVTGQAPSITAGADRANRAPLQKGGAMLCPVLLWIDLTERERHGESSTVNSLQCLIYRVSGAHGLGERIGAVQPHALCFEFDYPDAWALTMLSQTKHNHPPNPICNARRAALRDACHLGFEDLGVEC